MTIAGVNYSAYAVRMFELLDELIGLYLLMVRIFLDALAQIDKKLVGYRPTIVIASTVITILALIVTSSLFRWVHRNRGVSVMRLARELPGVKQIVNKQLEKVGRSIRNQLQSPYQDEKFINKLPEKRLRADQLLKKLKDYEKYDSPVYLKGRISGTIYVNDSDDKYRFLLEKVIGSTLWSNPLHADIFAGVRKMEAEIVRMVASMYRGNPDTTMGSVTSGGTESIIMACKAYRDYAIKHNRRFLGHNTRPEFIVPETAHAAFEKAANFLNCTIKFIPVDRRTLKVDVAAMQAAISSATCMLVGSAPNFPHGIIDPIEKIGQLGLKHRIPVHVDACLGGFLIPFVSATESFQLDEKFNLQVPGVTSISVDPHKYGYAPKGVSVLLYKEKKHIHEQYSIQTNWPGGIYASATIPGSRPGALIAACWTAMLYHGREGYVDATTSILCTTDLIKKQLEGVDGLQLMGKPHTSILAFKSDKFNILMLNDKLKELGWNLNALQFPPAFHFCLTLMHCNNKVAETFVKDVKSSVSELLADESGSKPAEGSSAAIYGMCQRISDRSIVAEVCKTHLDACLGH